MADQMKDWLGPGIEHELKEAVEWKQYRGFSDKDFSSVFVDNGSTLTARCNYPRDRTKVVQIIDIFTSAPIFKCRLSDGYISVKAKFAETVQEALQAQGRRDASALKTGMQISIPEFEINATTLGKLDERVQLTIQHALVLNSTRPGTYGNPRDIHERPEIQKTLATLKQLTRDALQDSQPGRPTTSLQSQVHNQGGTQVTQLTNGDSQAFATQALRIRGSEAQKSSAINLATPIMPARDTSGSASVTVPGRNGFKNPLVTNPMDMLSLLPKTPPKPAFVRYADRSDPQDNAGDDHLREGDDDTESHGEDPTSNGTHPAEDPHNRESIDLTMIEEDAQNVVEDVGMGGMQVDHNSDVDHAGRPDKGHIEGKNPASHDGNIIKPTGSQKQDRVSFSEDKKTEVTHSSMPKASQKSRLKSPAVIESQSSSGRSQQLPWHGITRMKLSRCIVPQDQQILLDRRDSWNPPAPGQKFPLPNVPRAALEQMESLRARKALAQEAHDNQHSSRPVSRDTQTSYSSRTPVSSPEQKFEWEATPSRVRQDELPPDSSVPGLGNGGSYPEATTNSQGDQDLPPDSSPSQHIMRSVELGSPFARNASRPGSRNQLEHRLSPRTSSMFSSAVNPGRTTQLGLDNPILLQPSSLSQSHFQSPTKAQSSSLSSPRDSSTKFQPRSTGEKVVASSYTPGFQSAQPEPTMQSLDGTRGSRPPDAVNQAADTDRMAEEQLQQELRASAKKISKTETPSDGRESIPSSPLERSSSHRDDDAMELEPKSPPQILGKRVPSSPASARRRPPKSRFGFSQEEDVSQDPARVAAEEKRKFMAARKQENRSRLGQTNTRSFGDVDNSDLDTTKPHGQTSIGATNPDLIISSSPPTGPRSLLQNVDGDKMQKQPSTTHQKPSEDSAQPISYESLYQEFADMYSDYKGNLKHFSNLLKEIDLSGNRLHPFLWDDFVVRNKTDYLPYSMDCLESGERPISYETFYTKRIVKPKYTQGVLTRDKLDVLFAPVGARPSSSHQASPRNRGRRSDDRPPSGPRMADRYIPPPRSPPSATPAATAQPPRRPKNNFVMMKFGPDTSRDTTRRVSGNAFNQTSKASPNEPSDKSLAESSRPPSTAANAAPRRSMPWPASNRTSAASDYRPSGTPDARRGSTRGGRKF